MKLINHLVPRDPRHSSQPRNRPSEGVPAKCADNQIHSSPDLLVPSKSDDDGSPIANWFGAWNLVLPWSLEPGRLELRLPILLGPGAEFVTGVSRTRGGPNMIDTRAPLSLVSRGKDRALCPECKFGDFYCQTLMI